MMTEERHLEAVPIRWSTVLSGSFVALGVWLFLYALGAAIGGLAEPAHKLTAWTAVYVLASPIIGLFCGGLVASRAAGSVNKPAGALHGMVIWGFSMVIGLVVLATLGAAVIFEKGGVNVPAGYSWAIAGAILGSLITAVAGASLGAPSERRARRVVGTTREVHP